MDVKIYKQNVEWYVISMTFFKQIYDEGFLNKNDYELIESVLAYKYCLSSGSVFREKYKLEYHPFDCE